MSSKHLGSILSAIPAATAAGQEKVIAEKTSITLQNTSTANKTIEEYERIVARIPRALKKEIKEHIENNVGETEKTLVLKGLKLLGFNVKNEWLVDQRSQR